MSFCYIVNQNGTSGIKMLIDILHTRIFRCSNKSTPSNLYVETKQKATEQYMVLYQPSLI